MALYDLFISYGRADSKAFVIDLHRRLSDRGYRVWLDLDDIPFAVDYQVHIDKSIEQSHNLLFVLSPTPSTRPTARPKSSRGYASTSESFPSSMSSKRPTIPGSSATPRAPRPTGPPTKPRDDIQVFKTYIPAWPS